MSKIYNLPNLLIQTNTEREYKLVSDETGSLHNVIVESKDQTTINIDLTGITFEGIEFQPNSDLGATTLEWIKNTTNIPFNTVEQREITCAEELKTTYREELKRLKRKGYSIELPAIDYKGLCLLAEEPSTVSFGVWERYHYWYSFDGDDWFEYTDGQVITLNTGDKVYWKGDGRYGDDWDGQCFVMTGKISAHGSAMSLLGDEYGTTLTDFALGCLFYNCTSLVSVDEDLLPATTLAHACYSNMFEGCSNLTNAPKLPATTLARACYFQMFDGCTSLTTAPELPAEDIAGGYTLMFANCSNLNYIKVGATSWDERAATDWVKNVSPTGTFVKPSATTIPTGVNGIPTGWVVESDEPVPEKYKLNITTDATYSDWHNLITEPHTSFMKNLIGDDGENYGEIYGYYDAPTGYVYINVDTKIVDWYNKFTFVNIFVGLMDMMYNSTSKVYEGYDRLHCYITMFGKDGLPDYQWTNTVMSISLMTNNVDWSAYSNYSSQFGAKSNWDCTLYDQVGHVLKEETVPFGNEMYFNSLSFYNRPTIINP